MAGEKAENRRAVLEGIAYSDDPGVSPSDRLRALEQLGDVPDDEAALKLVAEVSALTDDELDRELAGHAIPGEWDQEHVEKLVSSRTTERVRTLTAALRSKVQEREAELDAEVALKVEAALKGKGQRGPTEEEVIDVDSTEIPLTDLRALAPPGLRPGDINQGPRRPVRL